MLQTATPPGTVITEEYREVQRKLHEDPNYGVASVSFAPMVAHVIRGTGATEVLDYGAGKGRLGIALREHVEWPLNIHYYDPAVPAWSAAPAPCNFVACIDVLEHIEPHLLENVLDDLQRVTAGVGLFTVHTQAAGKVLADGRNAHLIQRPAEWWLPKVMDRFELVTFNRIAAGFIITVERKKTPR